MVGLMKAFQHRNNHELLMNSLVKLHNRREWRCYSLGNGKKGLR